jgi:hypothetical protein
VIQASSHFKQKPGAGRNLERRLDELNGRIMELSLLRNLFLSNLQEGSRSLSSRASFI